MPDLIVTNEELVVLETEEVISLIASAEQGPPGPPGPAGGSVVPSTAGEVTSALRVLYELNGQAFPLDYRDTEHIQLLLGISLNAAPAGAQINVQRFGPIEDAAWSWTPGRLWLGPGGTLTQTPPADGYDVLMGTAVSASRIFLNPQDPINLE